MRHPRILFEHIESRTHLDGAILLDDPFDGPSVNQAIWAMPYWTGDGDGTFIGRTQLRVSQHAPYPPVSGGTVKLALDTFNPTGTSFYGSQISTRTMFDRGTGLTLIVRARFIPPVSPGTVAGLFFYNYRNTSNHDELDIELLGNDQVNDQHVVRTNTYSAEPLGEGHPYAAPITGIDLTTFHEYTMVWLPGAVRWLVDGVLVRTDAAHVPAGPMAVHLNIWAPGTEWPEAYSAALQPATSAAANTSFLMEVDHVKVKEADLVSPAISTTMINGGSAQRSMVRSAGVTFSEPVALQPGAVTVRTSVGQPVPNVTVNLTNPSGDAKTYFLTFSGPAAIGGSLPDGIYDLKVSSSGVSDTAGNVMTGDYSHRFHRLFGDTNGDRHVTLVDYRPLRTTLGRSAGDPLFNNAFDYDGSNTVNLIDLAQFRRHYGRSVTY